MGTLEPSGAGPDLGPDRRQMSQLFLVGTTTYAHSKPPVRSASDQISFPVRSGRLRR